MSRLDWKPDAIYVDAIVRATRLDLRSLSLHANVDGEWSVVSHDRSIKGGGKVPQRDSRAETMLDAQIACERRAREVLQADLRDIGVHVP